MWRRRDDELDEADGKVAVMVLEGGGYEVGAASSATVAVLDDDDPVVELAVGSLRLMRGAVAPVYVALSSTLTAGRSATLALEAAEGDGEGLVLPSRAVMSADGTRVELELSAGRSAALGVMTLRLTVSGDGIVGDRVLLAVEVIPFEVSLRLPGVALREGETKVVLVSLSDALVGEESVSVSVASGDPDVLSIELPEITVLDSKKSTLEVTVAAREVASSVAVTLTAQATETTELSVLPGEATATVEPVDVTVELAEGSLRLMRGAMATVDVALSSTLTAGRNATLVLSVDEGDGEGLTLPSRAVTSADGASVTLALSAGRSAALGVTTLRLTVEGENVAAGAQLLRVEVIPFEMSLVLSVDKAVLKPDETAVVTVSLSAPLIAGESVSVSVASGDPDALSIGLPEITVLDSGKPTLEVTVAAREVASPVPVTLTGQATKTTELSVSGGETVVTVEPGDVTATLTAESLQLRRGAMATVDVALNSTLTAGRSATLVLSVDEGDGNGLMLPGPRLVTSADGTRVVLALSAGRSAALGVTTLRLTVEGENVAAGAQLLRVEVIPFEVSLVLSADRDTLKADETAVVTVSLSAPLIAGESVSVSVASVNPDVLEVVSLTAPATLNSGMSTLRVTVRALEVSAPVRVMLRAEATKTTELSVLPGEATATVGPSVEVISAVSGMLQLRRGASTQVVVELSPVLLGGGGTTLMLSVVEGGEGLSGLPVEQELASDGTRVELELRADRSAPLGVSTLRLTVESEGVETEEVSLTVEVIPVEVSLVLSADRAALKPDETAVVTVSLSAPLIAGESVSVSVASGDPDVLSIELPEITVLDSKKSTLEVTVAAREVASSVAVTLTAQATETTELSVSGGETVVTVEPAEPVEPVDVMATLTTESLQLRRGAMATVDVALSSTLTAGRNATLVLSVDEGDGEGLTLPSRAVTSADGASVTLALSAGRSAALGVTTLRLTVEGENVAAGAQLLRVEVIPFEVSLVLSADRDTLKADETAVVTVSLSAPLIAGESMMVSVASGNPDVLSIGLPEITVLDSGKPTLEVTVAAREVASPVPVTLTGQATKTTELSVLSDETMVTVEPGDVMATLTTESLQLRRGAMATVDVALSSTLTAGRSATLALEAAEGDGEGLVLPSRAVTSADGTRAELELRAGRSAALGVTTLRLTVEGENVAAGAQLLRVEVIPFEVSLVLSADRAALKPDETAVVTVSLSAPLIDGESMMVSVASGNPDVLSIGLPEITVLDSGKPTLEVTVAAREVASPVPVTLTGQATKTTELSVLSDETMVTVEPGDVMATLTTESLQLRRGAMATVDVALSSTLTAGRSATLALEAAEGDGEGLVLPSRAVTSADGTRAELELRAGRSAALGVTTLRLTVEGENVAAGAQLLAVEVIPVEVSLRLPEVALREGETKGVVVSLSDALVGEESVSVSVTSVNPDVLEVVSLTASATLNSEVSTLSVTVRALEVSAPVMVMLRAEATKTTELSVLPGEATATVGPSVEVISAVSGMLQLRRGASTQVVVELSPVLLGGGGTTLMLSVVEGGEGLSGLPVEQELASDETLVELALRADRSAPLGVSTLRLTVESEGVETEEVSLTVEVIPFEVSLVLSADRAALKPDETAVVSVSLSAPLIDGESVSVSVASGDPDVLSIELPEITVLDSKKSTLEVTVAAREVASSVPVTLTAAATRTTELSVLSGETMVTAEPKDATVELAAESLQLRRDASAQVVVALSSALLEGRSATLTLRVDQGDGDGLILPGSRVLMPADGTRVELALSAGRSAPLGVTTLRLTVSGDGIAGERVLLAVEVIPVEVSLVLSADRAALKPDETAVVSVSLSARLIDGESVLVTVSSGDSNALSVEAPASSVLSSATPAMAVTVRGLDVSMPTPVTLTAEATRTTELSVLSGETMVTAEPKDATVELAAESLQLRRDASAQVVVALSSTLTAGRSATLALEAAEGDGGGLVLPSRAVTSADGELVVLALSAGRSAPLGVTTLRLTVSGDGIAGERVLLAVEVIPVEVSLALSEVALREGETKGVVVSLSDALVGEESVSVSVTSVNPDVLEVVSLTAPATLNSGMSTLRVTVRALEVSAPVRVMLRAEATKTTELSVLPSETVATVRPPVEVISAVSGMLQLRRGAESTQVVALSSALLGSGGTALTVSVDGGAGDGLRLNGEVLPFERRLASDETRVELALSADRAALLGVTTLRLTVRSEGAVPEEVLLLVVVEVISFEVSLELSAVEDVLKTDEMAVVEVSLSDRLVGEESMSVTVTSVNPDVLEVVSLTVPAMLNSEMSTLSVTVRALEVLAPETVMVMLRAEAMTMTELSVLPGATTVAVEPAMRAVATVFMPASVTLRQGLSAEVDVTTEPVLRVYESLVLAFETTGDLTVVPETVTLNSGSTVVAVTVNAADMTGAVAVRAVPSSTTPSVNVEAAPGTLPVTVDPAIVTVQFTESMLTLTQQNTTGTATVTTAPELAGSQRVEVRLDAVTAGLAVVPDTVTLTESDRSADVIIRVSGSTTEGSVAIESVAVTNVTAEIDEEFGVLNVIVSLVQELRFRIRVFLEGALQ